MMITMMSNTTPPATPPATAASGNAATVVVDAAFSVVVVAAVDDALTLTIDDIVDTVATLLELATVTALLCVPENADSVNTIAVVVVVVITAMFSVAALLLMFVSMMPTGAVAFTVGVIEIVPLALIATSHVTVYTTELSTGNVTLLSLMLPVPLPEHIAPPMPLHVQLHSVNDDGIVFCTVTPVAGAGPALLLAVMLNMIELPV